MILQIEIDSLDELVDFVGCKEADKIKAMDDDEKNLCFCLLKDWFSDPQTMDVCEMTVGEVETFIKE